MIRTRYIEDYVYESENEKGDKVVIDMRDEDEKQSLSPAELLLSAVSGCVVVDIVLILKKKRKNVHDIHVETTGVRKNTHPRGFTHMDVRIILTSEDVKKDELLKVSKLALEKYCTVADSLRSKINLSVDIIRP